MGGFAATVAAHDERPQPVVTLRIVPAGTRLDVTARIPSRALSVATLPIDSEGRLVGAPVEPLRLVARDLINSLELQQDGAPLPSPTMAVTTVDGGEAVQIALGYLIRADNGKLGIRLTPFRGQLDLVPVDAEHVQADGGSRHYRVSTTTERILLAPTGVDAVRGFFARGAQLLVSQRELLLFVLGLALPLAAFDATRRRDLWTLLVAETVGSIVAGVGLAGNPSVAQLALAAAASATLVAMVQTVASLASEVATPIWGVSALESPASGKDLHHARSARTALVAVFGLAAGVALGRALGDSLGFAGGHTLLAFVTGMVVVLLGQWWLMSVFVLGLGLAQRAGVRPQLLIVGGLIYIGHEAMHAIAGHLLPVAGQIGVRPDYLVEVLALLWILTVVAIGAVDRRASA